MKRKTLQAALLLLLAMSALLLWNKPEARQVISSTEGILRLHIKANSDSDWDQQTKRMVRDALLPLFSACGSYEEARAYVLAHGQEVQQTCEAVLARRGETYGASLLLGKQTFPDRVYADTLYPAGTYDALEVVLGEGGGHNWWCVLFPPLCLVTEEGEPVDLDALSFESDVLALLKAAFPGWFK